MSEYHDDNTVADLPAAISLSETKLRVLQPELFGWRALFTTTKWNGRHLSSSQIRKMLREHLLLGDSGPALVVSTTPNVVIAAYTDELDAVVFLRFPPTWAARLKLAPGLRLLTVNTYGRGSFVSPDLKEGPRSLRRYAGVFPLIAETLSDDVLLIQQRRTALPIEAWDRAQELVDDARKQAEVRVREGTPLRAREVGTLFPFPKA